MADRAEWNTLRRAVMERAFARMNNRQREAVFHTEGPLLILAGAGSGKTTVLIHRIINLVRFGKGYAIDTDPGNDAEFDWLRACAYGAATPDERVLRLCAVDPCPAWKILAITFTNKAAGELKERLRQALGDEGEEVTAGTFHSFCARILRRDSERIGYSAHFVIYDSDDSRRLMKECLKSLDIGEKILPPKSALGEISRAKDSLISPEEFAAQAGSDYRLKKIAQAYALYQQKLKEADAMDFDDLLYHTVKLFEQCPDVLDRYRNRYRYLMVDEYQDTNHAQYRLVSLLASQSGNLCVVGDDDQSIYRFRGATIENILEFEDEFARCRVIRLEQNYRSTGRILQAANEVIAHNTRRKGKTLWTENPEGDPLSEIIFDNEDEEARAIANIVLDGVVSGRRLRDHVILYRANAQSAALERAFIKAGVPYRLVGGHRFFDRKEVRDAMAYLRIIHNPSDRVSLQRIINEPKRGIGDTTMAHAAQIADGVGITLYEVLRHADEYPTLSRAAAKLKSFTDKIDRLRDRAESGESLVELYNAMLEESGYLKMWTDLGEPEKERVDNLKELASSLERYMEENGDEASLSGFLEEAALMTDADNYDAGADVVTMMTMHAAKGLEFPIVFLPGFEEGVFPNNMVLFQPEELEEERRICYVALTRARDKLYLTHARARMLYGQTTYNKPSRFLGDIPSELIEVDDRSKPRFGNYGGYGDSPRGERRSTYTWGSTVDYDSDSSFDRPVSSFSRTGSGSGGSFLQRQNSSAIRQKPQPSAPTTVWKAGDRVRHRAFGVGTILNVSPMGNDSLLAIQFEDGTVKKLMANFAHLENA